MTLQRFQNIVLRLGNQMFVRHYFWLNYPDDPQIMGFSMVGAPSVRLLDELKELGFTFDERSQIWKISRDADEMHPSPHPTGVEA